MKTVLIVFLWVLLAAVVYFGIITQIFDHTYRMSAVSQKCIDAVSENDYEKAHKYLNILYVDYIDNVKYTSLDNPERVGEYYWTLARNVFKSEMQYLLLQNDIEANLKLIIQLLNMNAVGTRPTPYTKYSRYSDSRNYSEAYSYFCREYNTICMEVLEVSIVFGNENMASQILKLFKEEFAGQVIEEEDSYKYVYTIDNSLILHAKKRFDQAKKEGSFNQ